MALPNIQFTDAKRVKKKASIALEGLPGTGKSGLALALAYGLTGGWDKIAALDTENQSLPLYIGITLHTGVRVDPFSIGYLTAADGYKPSHYNQWRELAASMHKDAFIIDSFSHMWTEAGGVLDTQSQVASETSGGSFAAWNKPEVRDEKNLIPTLFRHPDMHCICTVRTKEKSIMQEDTDGKTRVISIGEQQINMPNVKYEPDLVLTMLEAGTAEHAPLVYVTKSRYSPFIVGEEYHIDANLIEQMRLFLEEGADPEDLAKLQVKQYSDAIQNYLVERSDRKPIWNILKENAGQKGKKVQDIPLAILKDLYQKLTN